MSKLTLHIAVCSFFLAWAGRCSAAVERPPESSNRIAQLENQAYHLAVIVEDGEVKVALDDKLLELRAADGPCLYRADLQGKDGAITRHQLSQAAVTIKEDQLAIGGTIAGLDLEHVFILPRTRALMDERIVLRNLTAALITLADFEAGLQRRVTDREGKVFPELAPDRWIAVPFRVRASDPKGKANDFSMGELLTQPGYEPRMNKDLRFSTVPSRHRVSEGWAWAHGKGALGIFHFNQEHMLFSVVSTQTTPAGVFLRFGGACQIGGEPAALSRIAPGQTVDLGVVRYQSVAGGYREASYAFRAMLDEKGCRFPADYNPPVHWEQLYDMSGAWEDRPRRYTKAILEKEAVKGRDYSCEALYLDPGWDTDFGTFLWGEQWLGPRQQFLDEMQSKHGLKVALHCPLASWMSHAYSWGLGATNSWPKAAVRVAPPENIEERTQRLLVPPLRQGRRNLALLAGARPKASSVYQNGAMPIHQTAHLNDGWYGNSASWIADKMPAWAEVDLGAVYQVAQVCIGNDHAGQYTDRAATTLQVLVATEYSVDSSNTTWRAVAQYQGDGIQAEKVLSFDPHPARWVRVVILKSEKDLPRLDELEIYESTTLPEKEAQRFAQDAKRGPRPKAAEPLLGPVICLGSQQYRKVAEERLLEHCANGVVFLMFDGNWWNGGCLNANHGHPVPYRMEDHIRANLDLAQKVHERYPKVLIEMHDMLAGGTTVRMTPVYYKYGLPGSYDENWGFELMWDPMADLKEGRARTLYYYNLGCNIPLYLHIDLRKDNEHCVVLWWYASTCRHLGIGGTSPSPAVVQAQKEAMRRYRAWDQFYKRGEFYGIDEAIHVHMLPKEKAFIVNLFNLSDQPRTIAGSIELSEMGLGMINVLSSKVNWGSCEGGVLKISLPMAPWSAQVAEFRATN